MGEIYNNIKCAAEYLKCRIKLQPKAGIVLGSGLGDTINFFKPETIINYSDIPGFPVSTVSGHAGRFLAGTLNGIDVIIMQGRIHYYEGYSMEQVVMPIRVMGMLGISSILITNAAGGISENLQPGDIMIIEDHISSYVPSPLIGPNEDNFGERFPDMSRVYDMKLSNKLFDIMTAQGLTPKRGVYLQVTGPQYETPSEIRAFKMLGADAVGMSTVCEAIAARHMGIRVAALSAICNKAAGLGDSLNHMDVLNIGQSLSVSIMNIIDEYIKWV